MADVTRIELACFFVTGRWDKTTALHTQILNFGRDFKLLAPLARLELATDKLEIYCTIQLCYKGILGGENGIRTCKSTYT